MLRTRWRFGIILIVIFSAAFALSFVLIARALNLETNLKDPLYFDSRTYSRFEYNNGTAIVEVGVDSFPVNDTHAICNVTYDGQSEKQFYVNHSGNYIDPSGKATNNFTIFWVHIAKGAGSEAFSHIGHKHSVFDPVGILGKPNTEYILTITEHYVYWSEEGPLHGAQFSLIFELRNLNGTLVAKGEMDYTCGMLFILDIGAGELRTLELTDTNYGISRNRLTGWYMAIPTAFVTPCLVFCILHFRAKKMSRDEKIDITFLVAAGEAVFIIDIMIDVWMYAPLGFRGNLLLHAIVTLVFAIYAFWRKIGLKWVTPAFLELAFLVAMVRVTSDAYVPHLTAFMGLLISWLLLIYATGYERIQSTTKLGKLISEFV